MRQVRTLVPWPMCRCQREAHEAKQLEVRLVLTHTWLFSFCSLPKKSNNQPFFVSWQISIKWNSKAIKQPVFRRTTCHQLIFNWIYIQKWLIMCIQTYVYFYNTIITQTNYKCNARKCIRINSSSGVCFISYECYIHDILNSIKAASE